VALDVDRLSVRRAERFEVQAMIDAHYLHKWHGVVVATIALCRDDVAVGVAVFALPPRETAKRYGGATWELARLWVHDDEPRNTETWFLARAVRLIRRERPDVRYLVSYADPSVGHVGTVYRAANWRADGRTDEERKTPRFDYECDGKRYSRRAHVPVDRPIVRVPRVSKARYVLALARSA
jgi:hypothetical protein